jgi:hypothetical protein
VDLTSAGLQELLMADSERLYKSTKQSGRNVSKCINSNVCKDSYNEAIENGYTTSEASVITGAMAVAMWKATKYASYILGDYEVKVLRKHKTAMKTEQEGLLKKLFASVAKEVLKRQRKRLGLVHKVVSNIFGKLLKFSSCFTLQDKKVLRKWLKSYFKTVWPVLMEH